MICTRENIKGFTLIEVMAAMFIISVVISILGNSFIFSYKNEKNNEKNFRKNEYINQAYSIIEYAITYGQKSVFLSDSDIIIIRDDNGIERRDKITVSGSNLVIKYDEDNTNYILKDITLFNPVKKGNLFYINIEYKGENYTRCIEEKDLF
ncbi:MAG: prepilin-type N-terminal cleavage/methylation domain-containing protein [Bacillota bacterium]|nr:prepilin-type N-terminal cleavage/methylation domain-containing protein [Bacillota bacterium]